MVHTRQLANMSHTALVRLTGNQQVGMKRRRNRTCRNHYEFENEKDDCKIIWLRFA